MKKLFVVFVTLVAINANAQWVQMSNGMGTDKIVNCFASIGNNIFAGTVSTNGIFLSTNNGTNWTAINNGIIIINSITAFAVSGANIFAGSNGSGVYLSTNNGTSWTSVNNGLTNKNVWSLAISGSNIFAGTYGGIFLSTNNGSNWVSVGFTTFHFYSLAASESYIYAGATPTLYPNTGGVLLSTNNGTNWTQPFIGLNIYELAVSGTNVYGGTGSGLFLSTNNGSNWNAINNGLTNLYISAITVSGTNSFTGTGGGVFLSTNNGAIWTQKNQGFNVIPEVDALITSNGYIFAGTFGQSIWRRSLSEIIGIQNISTEIPSSYSLSQNYPNPFNPITNVKFSIVNAGDVKIVVYDIQGREVQTLVNERLQPGTYEAAFDGTMLTSGIYFYKLVTDGFTETKKMLLIK